MLKAAFIKIRPDKVDRLKGWMAELNRRQDEVRATFAQESMRQEIAYLLEGRDGPVLVYMMDAQDWDQARRAYQASTLAIDLQHREIMEEVSDGPAATEMLYECRMAAD
jgi:Family of unknown function (DUF6176)